MKTGTYRAVLIGTVLASLLTGMHMPIIHEIVEHGAEGHTDVVVATSVLVIATVAGAVALFRKS